MKAASGSLEWKGAGESDEMIEAREVSKFYPPSTLALDRISFRIEKGEVVGFVGPNGSGKSTALRILTTYLPPTSGRALVQGFDVVRESPAVRKVVGYLPENNPLYNHLRVHEYLKFRARLKRIPGRDLWHRIGECSRRCGVLHMHNRIIGKLSKGYRQRVGLAETLLGDPPILILDEPTIGLDPQQNLEVRSLINELSEKKTVLFSTHILSEVEKISHRVMVIVQGRIKAMDTLEGLRRRIESEGRLEAVLRIPGGRGVEKIRSLPGVERVVLLSRQGELFRLQIDGKGGSALREQVFRKAGEWGWILEELKGSTADLEKTFLSLLSENLDPPGGKDE